MLIWQQGFVKISQHGLSFDRLILLTVVATEMIKSLRFYGHPDSEMQEVDLNGTAWGLTATEGHFLHLL